MKLLIITFILMTLNCSKKSIQPINYYITNPIPETKMIYVMSGSRYITSAKVCSKRYIIREGTLPYYILVDVGDTLWMEILVRDVTNFAINSECDCRSIGNYDWNCRDTLAVTDTTTKWVVK